MGSRLLVILAAGLSRHAALRALLRIPFDAETHEWIDVLPDRTAGTLEAWLRKHPGVEVVCRDGSATNAEAIHRALPDTVQVALDGICGTTCAKPP